MEVEESSKQQPTSESICSDSISSESFKEPEPAQPGIISRVAGGAYNATYNIVGGVVGGAVGGAKNVAAPVLGGAVRITGTALTTSFGVAKSVGTYMLPARFKPVEPKDKSD